MHACSTFPLLMIIQEFSVYLKCGSWMNESTSPSWPNSSTGRTLHRHHRGQGSNPFSGLSHCCLSTAKIWWSNSYILSLFLARVNKTILCKVKPLCIFNMPPDIHLSFNLLIGVDACTRLTNCNQCIGEANCAWCSDKVRWEYTIHYSVKERSQSECFVIIIL